MATFHLDPVDTDYEPEPDENWSDLALREALLDVEARIAYFGAES